MQKDQEEKSESVHLKELAQVRKEMLREEGKARFVGKIFCCCCGLESRRRRGQIRSAGRRYVAILRVRTCLSMDLLSLSVSQCGIIYQMM